MSVKFTSDGPQIAELRNPKLGNEEIHAIPVASGQLFDGTSYYYDRNSAVEEQIVALEFEWLSDQEKLDLLAVWQDTRGPVEEFTYLDHKGVTWNAHFIDTAIRFAVMHDDVASSGTFTPDGGSEEYPTTTREKGRWATNVLLRLTAP